MNLSAWSRFSMLFCALNVSADSSTLGCELLLRLGPDPLQKQIMDTQKVADAYSFCLCPGISENNGILPITLDEYCGKLQLQYCLYETHTVNNIWCVLYRLQFYPVQRTRYVLFLPAFMANYSSHRSIICDASNLIAYGIYKTGRIPAHPIYLQRQRQSLTHSTLPALFKVLSWGNNVFKNIALRSKFQCQLPNTTGAKRELLHHIFLRSMM